MRRLLMVALLGSLIVTGCRRKPKPNVEATIEETHELAGVLHMADPRAAGQLLRGFHGVEQNAWRWTMQNFAVSLRPPANAANGAKLQLRFALPDTLTAQLGKLTLTARVNGQVLPAQTFDKPGSHVYEQDVPASALQGEAATVEFSLDKAFTPGQGDQRELGVVVASVGLEAK